MFTEHIPTIEDIYLDEQIELEMMKTEIELLVEDNRQFLNQEEQHKKELADIIKHEPLME